MILSKKCNIVVKFKYAEYTGIRKKHAHDQQKSTCSKTMTEYAEKCDIVIRRSKNTSFTHNLICT